MEPLRPSELNVPDATLDEVHRRIRTFPWHEMPADGGWEYGANLAYMKALCAYWRDGFDWRAQEAAINRHNHFIAEIDGIDIHFMHEKSSGSNLMPLILSHGWPGTVVEFLDFVEPLAHPERFGGKAEDGFDVVAPSSIGFGFSGKPPRPLGPRKMAGYYNTLMTEVLSYERYMAQGGDWGALVTSWVARHDKNCKGIHLNMVVVPPDSNATDLTDIEKKALEGWQYYQDWDSGYSKQQSTRPQSIGYGLVDSPVGLAAWIIEKYWAWTDSNGDPENVLTKDEMLDNIMVYWVNAAGASSARIYWESFGGGLGAEPITTPMGGTDFPREIFRTSERFAKKFYTGLFYWSVRQSGGHFAAFEQPSVYVEEIQSCFRQIR